MKGTDQQKEISLLLPTSRDTCGTFGSRRVLSFKHYSTGGKGDEKRSLLSFVR